MMRAKTTIRSLAESGNDISVVAEKANRELCEGNELNMFVTAWMAIMDLNTGDMKCINAGHEYPAVKHTGGEFEILKDKHRPPLGAVEDMVYEPYELHLDPGDCVYVYTDGIPEAIDPQEKMFTTDRIVEALNQKPNDTPQECMANVRSALDKFVQGEDAFDDQTMLCIVYHGKEN
jgi:serine phosphatase RsbU (regulator of sigma subunit)